MAHPGAAGQDAQRGRCLRRSSDPEPRPFKLSRTKLPDFSSKVCDLYADFWGENVSNFWNEWFLKKRNRSGLRVVILTKQYDAESRNADCFLAHLYAILLGIGE